MKNNLLYINDSARGHDKYKIYDGQRFDSKIDIFNDTGERIFEPLHNKTVIAGAAFTLQKLFSLDRNSLENTPTYDEIMDLDDAATASAYPTVSIADGNGLVVGSIPDETQRVILGFCFGMGGAGLESSDVFDVPYASWITPDMIVPFRYPLLSIDDVDENIYKGKKTIQLTGGQTRCAYYFKEFSNTPNLVQNYVSTIGTFSDSVSPANVYSSGTSADKAQSYVELHLKLSEKDCREFFITHTGLEQAKINQLSLVYGWKKQVSRTKLDATGNVTTANYEVYQQIRPFSVCHFPTELLIKREKGLSIVYTLYC